MSERVNVDPLALTGGAPGAQPQVAQGRTKRDAIAGGVRGDGFFGLGADAALGTLRMRRAATVSSGLEMTCR